MGSTFLVSGKVTLDTGQAQAGAKQVGSEIEKLSKTGIAGFEAAQQKVIDLRKQINSLRSDLEKTNDPAAQAKLNAALAQTQTKLKLAQGEMRVLSLESREAGEKVQLLAAQLGIQLPQGIGNLVSRLPALQAGLDKAFNAVIIFAFVRGVAQAINNWDKFQESLFSAVGPISQVEVKLLNLVGLLKEYSTQAIAAAEAGKKQSDEGVALSARVMKAQLDLNASRVTGRQRIIEEGKAAIEALQNEKGNSDSLNSAYFNQLKVIEQLKTAGKLRIFDLEEAKKKTEEFKRAQEGLRQAEQTLAQIRIATAGQIAALTGSSEDKVRAEYQATFDKFNELKEKYPQLHAEIEAALTDVTRAQGLMRSKLRSDELKKAAEDADRFSKEFQSLSDRLSQIGIKNRTGSLVGVPRIEFETAQEILAIRKDVQEEIDKLSRSGVLNEEQLANVRVDLNQKAATAIESIEAEKGRKIAELNKQAFEKVAGTIESFIDRVFIQAKSLSDVFHQFLTQLLGSFVKFISREIAAWALGMKQVSGGGVGGSGLGGILGSVLGGIFGTGAGGGSQGAGFGGSGFGGGGAASGAPTFGGIASLPLGGLGSILSASGGGGIPKAQGGATSGILGQLAFGKMDLKGLLMGGLLTAGVGLGIAAIGSHSPATGSGLGALSGFLLFGIPGAIVGGIVGLISGIFGRGRQKRQAAAIQDNVLAQAETAVTEYKRFKADFESTLEALDVLRSLGFEQTKSLGKPGRNAFDYMSRILSDKKREVDALEQERQLRGAALAGMPLPEFAVGGMVRGGGGGILALVHPGEFVMRKSAVDMLGTEFLGALNRAPRYDAGGAVGGATAGTPPLQQGRTIYIGTMNVYPHKGMSNREAAAMVVRGFRQASLDGALSG